MKYPLNNLDDSNFWHYSLQLSTYAWMLQKLNPNFIIKDLISNYKQKILCNNSFVYYRKIEIYKIKNILNFHFGSNMLKICYKKI